MWRGESFAVSFSLDMTTRDLFLAGDLRGRRLWLVLGWLFVLLVVYLSLTPARIELEIDQGDKFSHAIAYLVLMSWFANLYETPIQRVTIALGFIVMGITLEFAQGLVGYRSFEVTDMGANAAGVALGWLFAPPRTPNYLRIAERLWRAHS
jgi:VanZ family protein